MCELGNAAPREEPFSKMDSVNARIGPPGIDSGGPKYRGPWTGKYTKNTKQTLAVAISVTTVV